MKKIINYVLRKFGYSLVRTNRDQQLISNIPDDMLEPEFHDLYNFCKPYTMTSIERMYALYKSIVYILDKNINGDFVECGVWRGGSAMLIAKMFVERKITNRKIILFDTFEGMSEPSQFDIDTSGQLATEALKQSIHQKETSVWCLADITDVQNNMNQTGFSNDLIVYIKGKVEDTIPERLPTKQIALLRLDTDWYESTKHELIYLYPLLQRTGILIIDDYGHWQGCRKAVDEYLAESNVTLMLNRIDYTGRIGMKI